MIPASLFVTQVTIRTRPKLQDALGAEDTTGDWPIYQANVYCRLNFDTLLEVNVAGKMAARLIGKAYFPGSLPLDNSHRIDYPDPVTSEMHYLHVKAAQDVDRLGVFTTVSFEEQVT